MLFRLPVGFTFSPWPLFPQASLRSRTVGFPESGSDLEPLLRHMPSHLTLSLSEDAHPPVVRWFAYTLFRLSLTPVPSTVSGRVLAPPDVRVPRVPLPDWVLPFQNGLPGHFRRRYSPFHAHTDSCARPLSSRRLAVRLVRRVFAGCRPSLLEGGPSRHYLRSLCIGAEPHTPPCPSGALAHFFPDDVSLTLRRTSSAHSIYPCNATSTGWFFSRLQSFVYLSAPMLARPPYCTYRHFRGADGPYTPRIA